MRETGGEILIRFKNKWVGQLTFKPDASVRAGGRRFSAFLPTVTIQVREVKMAVSVASGIADAGKIVFICNGKSLNKDKDGVTLLELNIPSGVAMYVHVPTSAADVTNSSAPMPIPASAHPGGLAETTSSMPASREARIALSASPAPAATPGGAPSRQRCAFRLCADTLKTHSSYGPVVFTVQFGL